MFLRNPAADGIVVLLVVLLFFGPKRMPQLARSFGESIKELKSGMNDARSTDSTPSVSEAPEDPSVRL